MPIYEYRCRGCGHTFEELRPAEQADAPAHCTCGESDVARLPSLISRSGGGELPLAAGTPAVGGTGAAGGGCCGGGCCS